MRFIFNRSRYSPAVQAPPPPPPQQLITRTVLGDLISNLFQSGPGGGQQQQVGIDTDHRQMQVYCRLMIIR
jgi:hypothetical protein